MKTLLSSMVVITLALTACGEDAKTSDTEEKATPVVNAPIEQVAMVEEETSTELEAPAVQSMDKPFLYAGRSITATAKVEAINHGTREVTLLQEDGGEFSFIASEEVRNLNQVQVGDIVTTQYTEDVTVEVVAVENAEAAVGVIAGLARTKEGEVPGIAKGATIIVTATIEEINIEENTFKLKGPQGNIQEFTARNQDNLRKSAVGDLVVITHTKAIASSVEKTN